jgi:hypothetical protein
MKVKNIDGTSGSACGCGSWLNHWEKFSGQPIPGTCRESSCLETKLVGAHVQKDSSTDKSWYIVPLCAKHNAKSDSLSVMDTVVLVPANVGETCEKSLYSALSGLGGLYSTRR